jgi:hypothetical protein
VSNERPAMSEGQLAAVAETLLAAVHPDDPANAYFPPFAHEKLRWMSGERAAGRLEVAFYDDTADRQLPRGVLMAAWRTPPRSTIFISRPALRRVPA